MTKTYNNSLTNKLINQACEGRLTLVSGAPYNASDITGSVLYFSPFDGNTIGLYNNNNNIWDLFSFSELSISLAGWAANTNYDIFVYNASNSIILESQIWNNNSTRNVNLVRQDGILVNTNSKNKRYIGTIRTYETGLTADTQSRRFVWNYYHRKTQILTSYIGGTTKYNSGQWRPYANNTTIGVVNCGRTDFICGDAVDVNAGCHFHLRHAYGGLGIDAESPFSSSLLIHENAGYGSRSIGHGIRASANNIVSVGAGYHFLQLCQHGVGSPSEYYWAEQRSSIQG